MLVNERKIKMDLSPQTILSANKTNKEKILEAIVDLLDERGYPKVSMRDIAAKVGIKASSIYNHFRNKEAILDEMIVFFNSELKKRSMNEVAHWDEAELSKKTAKTVLLRIMLEPLTLLDDPFLNKIIRIAAHSQYYHVGTRDFLLNEMFDKPLKLLKHVLSQMIAIGLVVDLPVDFLAAELQGVMIAHFYQLSLQSQLLKVDPEKIRKAMETHVDFFWRAVGKN
jgi:AcrR family transcriptional regulator